MSSGSSLFGWCRSCSSFVPGWKAVIMEEIDGVPLHEAKSCIFGRNKAKTTIYRIFPWWHSFCEHPITHNGDIRIIDFDWAGKEGVVTYPAILNTDIPWHPDVSACKLIMKSHDQYGLDQLLLIYAYYSMHKWHSVSSKCIVFHGMHQFYLFMKFSLLVYL